MPFLGLIALKPAEFTEKSAIGMFEGTVCVIRAFTFTLCSQGCLRISSLPFGRSCASFYSILVRKSRNSSLWGILAWFGISSSAVAMFWYIRFRFLFLKGVTPNISSYVTVPIDQISAAWSYISPFTISGAWYSGVPQIVLLLSPQRRILVIPKSIIFK